MGNVIILFKDHPDTLQGDEKLAEHVSIALLGGADGPQFVQECHFWYDHKEKKQLTDAIVLKPQNQFSFEESRRIFIHRIVYRSLTCGFVHSRNFNFPLGRFVYHDLRQTPGFSRLKDLYERHEELARQALSDEDPLKKYENS